ncbi:MAG TPA: FAD-dependent oxidoreductase [Novosphingobium sp.]|nr:FAD-dependent oxidoreductase [Novosphingobium sp.]
MMDRICDVLVVGAGTAGIPAALGAAQRGLDVLLVEAAQDVGGTLHLSSASISAAGTSLQAAHGIEDSAEQHFADALRINHGTGDHALLRRWTQDAAEMVEWLLSIGWTCTPDTGVFAPEHDLYSQPRTYRSTHQGFEVLDAYRAELARVQAAHKLDISLGTRMTDLLVENGRVVGITATQGGHTQTIRAGAVIMATGGFSGSARHWQEIHGIVPLRYHVPTVMGDHIDAVRAAGGELWFTDYCLPAFGGTRDIGSPAAAWIHSVILPSARPPWEIYVNQNGDRFMAEDEPSIDQRERAAMAQPDWAFWVIYDEAIRQKAPPLFRWPEGKLEELFAGFDEDYVTAPDIATLAARTGMPEARLAASIDLYNRAQAVGSDALRRKHMPAPIGTPDGKGPFYAVRHYGCSISCYPGMRVDTDLRALRSDDSVIEGLYGCGEAIGIGFLGHGFLSGSIVSAAITFGRRLGREVMVREVVA